jgi:hypothetical protein
MTEVVDASKGLDESIDKFKELKESGQSVYETLKTMTD